MRAGGPFFDAISETFRSIIGCAIGLVGAIFGGSFLGLLTASGSIPDWERLSAPLWLSPFLWLFSFTCFATNTLTVFGLFALLRADSTREVWRWLGILTFAWALNAYMLASR